MANMSYCMFENTSTDIQQLISACRDAACKGELDLGEREAQAWRRLPRQMEKLMELMAELEEADEGYVDKATRTAAVREWLASIAEVVLQDTSDRDLAIRTTTDMAHSASPDVEGDVAIWYRGMDGVERLDMASEVVSNLGVGGSHAEA